MNTNEYPIKTSLLLFAGFLFDRIMGSEHVWRKYPAQKMPHNGAKLAFTITRVLPSSAQIVLSDYAAEPITKLVSPSAMKPIAMIKAIRSITKTTPNEPIRMKIPRSFLLQSKVNTTKRNRAV